MEGISHEACSLAGTLGLGKLIVFYDDNGISIDGDVRAWFSDDTAARFASYHWQVIGPIDGHDPTAIDHAISVAQAESERPTLIICKTMIGYGAPSAGNASTHGAPLGPDEILALRKTLDWPYSAFVIPDALYDAWNHHEQGLALETDWLIKCHSYQQRRPGDYDTFLRRINGDLPDDWRVTCDAIIEQYRLNPKPMATRKASQHCLEQFAALLPELLGGSADLTGSNNTNWSGSRALTQQDFTGNYIHYGVREFAMAAIMNGIALHGGYIPYGGTFLVFSDYARNALRLSALMHQRVIFIFTHDSIGLGEDGPTHQPIEHAAMLRMTPNMRVWRPADQLETAVAWRDALERHHGPSCLLLSRQTLPVQTHPVNTQALIRCGGYILQESDGIPDVILIATGSEVQIAIDSANAVQSQGIRVRVVSMPCAESFLETDPSYQDMVLPKTIRKRIAIEAAASGYWYRFVGLDGLVIGLERFGISAPADIAYEYLGITVEKTINAILILHGSD
jgi:transketolase